MADTERLFRNLRDIKALDAADLLSEEQEHVLQDFFHDFSLAKNSEVKQKFLSLWEALLPIYKQFNASLAADGLAYEGAVYRRVAEALQEGGVAFPPDTDLYAFVGFNVLDKVETALFDYLSQRGKALFYWDYDVFYTRLPLEQKPRAPSCVAILPASRPHCPRHVSTICGGKKTLLSCPPRPKMHKPGRLHRGCKHT